MLVIGGLLLVVFLLVAAFAFLFSFIDFWKGVVTTVLWLSLMPFLLMVAGGVTIFTGLAWWKGDGGWFSGVAKARARIDRLRLSSRVGELIGVAFSLIVFAFLYENQLRGAAFFTPSFGSTAQFLFYGPLFTGALLSFARAIYGRRNGVRPFDSANALFLALAAFMLLSSFPFDFTHFGDMFPSPIPTAFFWLSNDIGRFLFLIAGFASMVNFVYTSVLYVGVRNQLASGAYDRNL